MLLRERPFQDIGQQRQQAGIDTPTVGNGRGWLDPQRTSPFAFYQFWLNQEDGDLERLLDAWFTRPEQLTGRLRYHLGQVRYSGDAPQLWDHSFDRAS